MDEDERYWAEVTAGWKSTLDKMQPDLDLWHAAAVHDIAATYGLSAADAERFFEMIVEKLTEP
jgi:hypothetical protein